MPNFFEQQHIAHRKTHVMIVLFVLSVIGVVVAIDVFVTAIYLMVTALGAPPQAQLKLIDQIRSVPTSVHTWAAAVTLGLIIVGSLNQIVKLRSGGEAIAAAIGARRIASNTTDPMERRLVNVVEEMAIASGVRLPVLYVMDKETGINGFAAGFNVSNTVIVVTRGMLQTLTRDELQGVIGHEFSHIVNGDVSINIRMMGVLAGIVVIGSIGLKIMGSVFEADSFSSAVAMFVAGLAICIIGFSGLVFARLIKASVSRQREFLADASSVQFTRNPDGIAGALDRIAEKGKKTQIKHRYAEDVSHMFFGQATSVWFAALFGTHPSVDERIKRVNPGFQRKAYRKTRSMEKTDAADAESTEAADAAESDTPAAAVSFFDSGATSKPARATRARGPSHAWGRSAGESASLAGTLDAGKVDYAQRLLAALPTTLRERLREPDAARAAIVALVLAPEEHVMEEQIAAARSAGAEGIADAARGLATEIAALGPAFQLPVIDLALASLKSTSGDANAELLKALEAVVYADRHVSLHEFAVLTLVRSQLTPRLNVAAPRVKAIATVRVEALSLLSLVAWAGARPGDEGQRDFDAAFRAGANELHLEDARPINREALDLDAARTALEKLRALAPRAKAMLVTGLFAAITADGSIRVIEAELMRMIGAVLDCPLPPLLDNLDPASLTS